MLVNNTPQNVEQLIHELFEDTEGGCAAGASHHTASCSVGAPVVDIPGLVHLPGCLNKQWQDELLQLVAAAGWFGGIATPCIDSHTTTTSGIRHSSNGNSDTSSVKSNQNGQRDHSTLTSPSNGKGAAAGHLDQVMLFGAGNMPDWLQQLSLHLPLEEHWPHQLSRRQPLFNTAIINLYVPGGGIKPHVDLLRFEDGIAIVSLGDPAIITFTPGDAAVVTFIDDSSACGTSLEALCGTGVIGGTCHSVAGLEGATTDGLQPTHDTEATVLLPQAAASTVLQAAPRNLHCKQEHCHHQERQQQHHHQQQQQQQLLADKQSCGQQLHHHGCLGKRQRQDQFAITGINQQQFQEQQHQQVGAQQHNQPKQQQLQPEQQQQPAGVDVPSGATPWHQLLLSGGDVLLLRGEARYKWAHGIAGVTEEMLYCYSCKQTMQRHQQQAAMPNCAVVQLASQSGHRQIVSEGVETVESSIVFSTINSSSSCTANKARVSNTAGGCEGCQRVVRGRRVSITLRALKTDACEINTAADDAEDCI